MKAPHWPTDFCDLVMEGGVTSGVVYPSAVVELAQRSGITMLCIRIECEFLKLHRWAR